MHVARVVRKYKDREYVSHLLRRSVRDGDRVRHETLANLTALPAEAIDALRLVLAGTAVVAVGDDVDIARSLPHGHVAAVWVQAIALGFDQRLGPACAERDLALALIVTGVCRPDLEPAATRWWAETTLAVDLGVAEAGTAEVYAAMDWLVARQGAIEAALTRDAPDAPDRWPRPPYREESFPAPALISMLARCLARHLRAAWAAMCPTDRPPPDRAASDAAVARDLAPILDHLATLTRNTIAWPGGRRIDQLATATPEQRRAFDLLGAAIPLTLACT